MKKMTAVLLATATAAAVSASPASAARSYANCTALHKDYPHGVGRSGARDKTSGQPVTSFKLDTALYNSNTKSDRDKDGIACEKE